MNKEQEKQEQQKEAFIKKVFIDDLIKADSKGSHIMKADIIRIAEEYGINFKAREGKKAIVNKIIQAGFYESLFNDFKEFIYIPSWVIGRYYGFNGGEEIDQLKTLGVIKEDIVKESFYSKDSKRNVFYNAYPLSVLNYDAEELKKAYDLAFNQLDFKIRVETKTAEEVPKIEEVLKRVFIVHNITPKTYEGREEGFKTYYNTSLLNDSEIEGNKLLIDIERLKKEIKDLKQQHREEIERINNKWCNAVGVNSFIEANTNKYTLEHYKSQIDTLKAQIKAYKTQGNIRGAGRKPRFTEEQRELILKDREKGLTMKQLAIKYNCGVGTIHKLIHENK